ncbi:ribonucleotide reductase N-terminal alpha domain-containing protein, partial [Campylobacter jejuni]
GRILLGLKEKYDLDDLNAYIKPERDMQFTYLGIKTLYDRYLIKDSKGMPIELPQQMFMAIAMFLAQNEFNPQEWAKKFYDLISKFELMLATPTLSNARTTRHQLSSCYIGSTPDNIEGIFDSYQEMALLSKFGGGIGWDWSKVRAMGGSIDGHKNAAGGIIPFLKITNDIAVAVDQLGTRKGAIAVYIEPWHMDISDFIDLRKNSGEERRRAHELFPALWINDLFMKRVRANDKWTLFDPADT